MPRFRFTVRKMMFAVAVAGLACGTTVLLKRRADFARRSAAWRWTEIAEERGAGRPEMMGHFARLAEKYEHAARHPWLAVEPDPPSRAWPAVAGDGDDPKRRAPSPIDPVPLEFRP